MNEKTLREILNRLDKLEKAVFAKDDSNQPKSPKTKTLPELVKGKKFRNGQEKVAVVIGYYEKVERKKNIQEVDIKAGWVKSKLDGKYRSNLLERSIGDGLIRDLEDGSYDLSQSGENFFDKFLKQNDTKSKE